MDKNESQKLEIDGEMCKVTYLGYELELTSDEYALIHTMTERRGKIEDGEFLDVLSPSRTITVGNIAVHVCNINRKAIAVGGRRIIIKRKRHYILDDNL